MDIDEMLNNMGGSNSILTFEILGLLKVPVIIILIINVFFSLLIFLRVRILADTFKTTENKIVKIIVLVYMFVVLVGSLLSLLFVMLT